MSRISNAFARAREEGRPALITFVTAGYPSLAATPRLIWAQVEGGADMIEIGMPFSDPLADGATIQRANFHALRQNITVDNCLEIIAGLRRSGLELPLILMGYYNPIITYGVEVFARAAWQAGADGVIAVDVPPEESDELAAALRAYGLDLIYLLAPTSTDDRIRMVAERASGFLYCVSVTGVTGARQTLPSGLTEFVWRVRSKTELPLVVGFGVSRRDHVEAIGQIADGVVIASALIDVIDRSPENKREENVRAYVEVVTGRRRATV